MDEITWTEAFLGKISLHQIREKEKLNIPDEYNKSVKKLSVALCMWSILLGALIGFAIHEIIIVIMRYYYG